MTVTRDSLTAVSDSLCRRQLAVNCHGGSHRCQDLLCALHRRAVSLARSHCAFPLENLLRSAILVPSNAKEMSLLSPFDGGPGGKLIGCFGTIIAHNCYIADDPPSHSDLGTYFDWLLLLLSDQNGVQRVSLHAAYYQYRTQTIEANLV